MSNGLTAYLEASFTVYVVSSGVLGAAGFVGMHAGSKTE